jgi:hypothetical protein
MTKPYSRCAAAVRSRKNPSGASISPPHISQTRCPCVSDAEVVRGGTVAEVRVNDHAQSLEFVEVAVNRREVHVWRNTLNLFGELFSSAVRTLFEETTQQDSLRRGGDATAALAQTIQYFFDRVNVGAWTLGPALLGG